MHGLLTERAYYYAVDETPETTKYAIVPSFRDWDFPAEGPPAAWAVQRGSLQRTDLCHLTNQVFPERAHLVPRFERVWLARSPLNIQPDAVDQNCNIMSLRADLHALFDRKMFAFVPLRTASTQSYSFVAHILDNEASGYYDTIQNYTVQQPFSDPMAARFLYARFAWSIIFRSKPFLTTEVARVVSVWDPVDGTTVKEMSGAVLLQAYGGGGMRDATPLKRTWAQRTGDLCDDDDYDEDEYSRYGKDSQRYGSPYVYGISQTVEADEETGGG